MRIVLKKRKKAHPTMPRLSHHHLRPIKGSIPYETMKQICEKYLKNTNEIKAWQEGLLSQVWVD